MSSVMGTEPAITVINYLWNRLGEAGAGGEAGNTEMETERFAYLKNSRWAPPNLCPEEAVTQAVLCHGHLSSLPPFWEGGRRGRAFGLSSWVARRGSPPREFFKDKQTFLSPFAIACPPCLPESIPLK